MLNGTVGSNPTLSAKTNAQIAQSVEQGTENPRVGGSIPPLGTIFKNGRIAQLGEHLPYKQGVIGSSPIVTTIVVGV